MEHNLSPNGNGSAARPADPAGAALDPYGDIPEAIRQVWARRAVQLAQKPVEADDRSQQVELVLVRLGCETYGFEVQYIQSIRPAEQITTVPRVPNWVAGVCNVRGNILSVINLSRYFNLPEPEAPAAGTDQSGPAGYLVMAAIPGMELAILVDDVLAVEPLPASRIQTTTDIIRGIQPEYVRGVAERYNGQKDGEQGDYLLLVLDLPALLTDPQLIINEEAL